jgi:hypothetical protein
MDQASLVGVTPGLNGPATIAALLLLVARNEVLRREDDLSFRSAGLVADVETIAERFRAAESPARAALFLVANSNDAAGMSFTGIVLSREVSAASRDGLHVSGEAASGFTNAEEALGLALIDTNEAGVHTSFPGSARVGIVDLLDELEVDDGASERRSEEKSKNEHVNENFFFHHKLGL